MLFISSKAIEDNNIIIVQREACIEALILFLFSLAHTLTAAHEVHMHTRPPPTPQAQECKKHLEEAKQGIESLRAQRKELQQKLSQAHKDLQVHCSTSRFCVCRCMYHWVHSNQMGIMCMGMRAVPALSTLDLSVHACMEATF